MKSFSKFLLLTAVAVMAIAVSAAPSEAAKKKKMKAMKPVSACATVGAWCTMGGSNVVHFCGGNQKWTPVVLPACVGPGCPPPCT